MAGWAAAHAYSRDVMKSPLAWGELLADAIEHAREGIAVSPGQRRVTAAAKDLITISRAKQDIQSITDSSQDTLIQTLVTACSDAIEKYCRRRFVSRAYAERSA